MLPDVRAELDRIETFLMRRDTASADLAAILTALRGPDTKSAAGRTLKNALTIPIRRAAFPRFAAALDTNSGDSIAVGRRRFMAMESDDVLPPNEDTVIRAIVHASGIDDEEFDHVFEHNADAIEAIRREPPR